MEADKQKRNLGNTSLYLERAFFDKLDTHASQAGKSWQQFTRELMNGKPPDISRASFLRVYLLCN